MKRKLFLMMLISAIFIYPISKLKYSDKSEISNLVYCVKIEYFGMDATTIEKIITTPLEEKLSELNSIIEIKSVCQHNESITTLIFSPDADKKLTYLQIKNIVEEISKDFPSDIQTPQILSNNIDDNFDICINLNIFDEHLSQNIKTRLEAIDGITSVIISGNMKNSIKISYDSNLIVQYGISPLDIAAEIKKKKSKEHIIFKYCFQYIN